MSQGAPAALPDLHEAYDLGEELGRGGLGVVFAATRRRDGHPSAVKLCMGREAPEDRARVQREAALLKDVSHPRLASLHGVYLAREGRLALVYDRIEGEDLGDIVARGAVAPEEVIPWVEDVGEALAAIHTAELVHRDVKVGNVIVGQDGRATLLDFGQVRPEGGGGTVTATGVVLCSPAYLAPEVFQGERPGRAADLYALGCLAYELLAGHPPFDGDPAALFRAHLEDEPPPINDLGPGRARLLANFFSTALAKEPDERFEDPSELVEALAFALVEPVADAPAIPGATHERAEERTHERGTWHGRTTPGPGAEDAATSLGPVTLPAQDSEENGGPGGAPGPRSPRWPVILVVALALGVGTGRMLGTLRPSRGGGASPPPLVTAPFPLPPGSASSILDELDAATLDPDPFRGPQTLRSLASVRTFEEWLAAGGDPEALAEGLRAELAALEPLFQARGVPSPFHPWVHLRPLAQATAIGARVRTEAVRHGIQVDVPASLDGWAGRALVALEAVLERTAAQEAELAANPTGPYPGGIEIPQARLVFGLGRIDMGRFLHRVNEERAHRIALGPWLSEGARLTRELLFATGCSLQREPPTRAMLASLVAGPMGSYKAYFASGLASDELTRILGGEPRVPEAWLVAAAIVHEQARIEKELRGLAGELREREPEYWARAAQVEGDGAAARHCRGLAMDRQIEVLRELQDSTRLAAFREDYRLRRHGLRLSERIRIEVELAQCMTSRPPLLREPAEARAALADSIEAGLHVLGGSAAEAAPALLLRLRLPDGETPAP